MNVVSGGKRAHPVMKTMGDALSRAQYGAAIARLLELGMIVAVTKEVSRETWVQMRSGRAVDFLESQVIYGPTAFGGAVMLFIAQRWNVPMDDAEEGESDGPTR